MALKQEFYLFHLYNKIHRKNVIIFIDFQHSIENGRREINYYMIQFAFIHFNFFIILLLFSIYSLFYHHFIMKSSTNMQLLSLIYYVFLSLFKKKNQFG